MTFDEPQGSGDHPFEPASVHLEAALEPRRGTAASKAARTLLTIAAGLLTNDLESGPSALELVIRRRSTGNEIIRVVAGTAAEADAMLAQVRRDLSSKGVADFLAEWRRTPDSPARTEPMSRRSVRYTTMSINGSTEQGVPFVAIPSETPGSPVVVVWHLLDPPRTPAAMASALPLDGLEATKIYLGLPLSGPRMPAGGVDEIMRLGMEEPVMNLHWPIHDQGVREFPAAWDELRSRFEIAPDARIALVGGSAGSSIAAGVLAAGLVDARAAVLVSPMLQLRPIVDVLAGFFQMDYHWTDESTAAAERMDFVARADEIRAAGADIRVIAGLDDDADAVLTPARDFASATGADLQELEGVAHALAEEPGIEPADQTPAARRVDALAVEWLTEHLA